VLVVVAVTLAPVVVVVEVVPVGIITALVVVVIVLAVVVVVVDVVVELPHDDNTKDVTKRKASDNKIIPLFM
jgi:hypothetical protein